MPQLSSNSPVSSEKLDELSRGTARTDSQDIDLYYEIDRCVEWIQSNTYQKVCLQFPDYLLHDSTTVALKLQNILGQTVYVLGDTAYESCCIDYIAAAHINADAIIHFGPTCFSNTTANIPYLFIYEKHPLSVETLEECISKTLKDLKEEAVILLLDTPYIHKYDTIQAAFNEHPHIKLNKIDGEPLNFKDNIVIFICHNPRKLINFDLNFQPKSLYYVNPTKTPLEVKLFEVNQQVLKRRYFLIEKIRDSQSIGIIIGTLGVKNYLKIIDRIKKLVDLSGKKYYLISVGKPTEAKLANFPEIDIYVMITCSMNEVYDSRDFYKPVVTPYDVEMALNTNHSDLKFSYDYNRYLNNLTDLNTLEFNKTETDVSLLTGKIRSNKQDEEKSEQSDCNGDNQIALKSEGTIALSNNFGAEFLNDRSWKGLEQNLGQTEVKLVEEGRTGIAQGYKNEMF